MHASYVTEQTWAYTCRHCGHQWTVTFEAHHTEGTMGMDYCVWSRNGLPSLAPDAGISCPRCSSIAAEGIQKSPEVWHE